MAEERHCIHLIATELADVTPVSAFTMFYRNPFYNMAGHKHFGLTLQEPLQRNGCSLTI